MAEATEPTNLPAQIAQAVAGMPAALVPSFVKAFDRLVGAAVDVPTAWLAQQKAKIDAQTQAYTLVEGSIATAAAAEAGGDQATVERAVNVLVRKQYQKQKNRDAVASAMLADLSSETSPGASVEPPLPLDEDWLNVFERYAEDASSERMQKLWGRVIGGEIRRPGRFSLRTLRFLSEFSQADALEFSELCSSTFYDIAPAKLVKPDDQKDIRKLIYLESSGLIQGASGLGLSYGLTFNEEGNAFIREGDLVIWFKGSPNVKVITAVVALTPLGQELVTLLPGRDARSAARKVAIAMRSPQLEEAFLGVVANEQGHLGMMEVLWQKEVVSDSQ